MDTSERQTAFESKMMKYMQGVRECACEYVCTAIHAHSEALREKYTQMHIHTHTLTHSLTHTHLLVAMEARVVAEVTEKIEPRHSAILTAIKAVSMDRQSQKILVSIYHNFEPFPPPPPPLAPSPSPSPPPPSGSWRRQRRRFVMLQK